MSNAYIFLTQIFYIVRVKLGYTPKFKLPRSSGSALKVSCGWVVSERERDRAVYFNKVMLSLYKLKG